MTDVVLLLRYGTLTLNLAIVFIFLFLALHLSRQNPDYLRARISLNADRVHRAILALLAGFAVVSVVSLSFVLSRPLEGIWELAVLYPWLVLTLYGTTEFFRAVYTPIRARGGAG